MELVASKLCRGPRRRPPYEARGAALRGDEIPGPPKAPKPREGDQAEPHVEARRTKRGVVESFCPIVGFRAGGNRFCERGRDNLRGAFTSLAAERLEGSSAHDLVLVVEGSDEPVPHVITNRPFEEPDREGRHRADVGRLVFQEFGEAKRRGVVTDTAKHESSTTAKPARRVTQPPVDLAVAE